MKKLVVILTVIFGAISFGFSQAKGSFIELEKDGVKTPLEGQRIGLLEQDNSVLSILRVRISDMKGYLNGTQLRFEHPVKRTPLTFRADQVTDHGNGDYYWTGFSAQGAISISKHGGNYSGYIDLPGEDEYILLVNLDTLKPYLIFIKPERAKQSAECGGTLEDTNNPLDPIYDDDYVEERCGDSNVRLLFLVADNADDILNARDVANMVTNELNGACQASNANATFVLAGVDRIPDNAFDQRINLNNPLEINQDFADLLDLWIFNNLRDQYKADLTVVFSAAAIPATWRSNFWCSSPSACQWQQQ